MSTNRCRIEYSGKTGFILEQVGHAAPVSDAEPAKVLVQYDEDDSQHWHDQKDIVLIDDNEGN